MLIIKIKIKMINVTHSAVNQIKKMMTSRSNMPHGVKLGINTKGCSGLSYTLEYVDNVHEGF